MKEGTLLKMKSQIGDIINYSLPIGDELLPLNPFIGKKIKLSWAGEIFDIHDGKPIKKSYAQGFSYQNFMKLAQCDTCIVRPELCHFQAGTCREPEWGEKHCFTPHIIYLANTSGLKIGITRETQVPTRWIDQGAKFALPILKVSDRKTSGLIEVEIGKEINDKTNWRKMLSGKIEEVDLLEARENLFEQFGDLLDDLDAEDLDSDVIELNYPVIEYPEKVKSLSFEKTPIIEGTLQGIKGQYLILDTGVLNIRKHQGHKVKWEQL